MLEGDADRDLVFRDASGELLGATPGGHEPEVSCALLELELAGCGSAGFHAVQ